MSGPDDPDLLPLDPEARFVLENYPGYLSPAIHKANVLRQMKHKVAHGGYAQLGDEIDILQKDTEAAQDRGDLPRAPLPVLIADAARRAVAGNPDILIIVRCPRCNGVPATPKARQCLSCGYDWH